MHWERARRAGACRRVKVERDGVAAANVQAGTVIDGRNRAIVHAGGIRAAEYSRGARTVVVRGRGVERRRA